MQSKAACCCGVVLGFVCGMHAVAVLNQTLLLCSILLVMVFVVHNDLCAGDRPLLMSLYVTVRCLSVKGQRK